jgi:ABC-type branched-subunit amino acid transport system ATPase component
VPAPGRSSADGALLDVSGVVAGYGAADVLHDVSLRVGRDELVAIVGPNGAGKSTLVKVVAGLLPPKRGSITFDGHPVVGQPPEALVRMGMAYLPQLDNVFRTMTVQENLELGGHMDRRRRRGKVDRILQLFPRLAGLRKEVAGNLSGGERQMLALGRTLMLEPHLLILDEPSAALAPSVAEAVFAKVVQLKEAGVALCVVEQNVERVLRVADRAYVLAAGENRFEGRGPEVLADPEIARLYLGG